MLFTIAGKVSIVGFLGAYMSLFHVVLFLLSRRKKDWQGISNVFKFICEQLRFIFALHFTFRLHFV